MGGDLDGTRPVPLASLFRKGMLLASEDRLEKGPDEREVDVESEREMLEFEWVGVGDDMRKGRSAGRLRLAGFGLDWLEEFVVMNDGEGEREAGPGDGDGEMRKEDRVELGGRRTSTAISLWVCWRLASVLSRRSIGVSGA